MTSVQTLKEQIKLQEATISELKTRLAILRKNYEISDKRLSNETQRFYTVMQHLNKYHYLTWLDVRDVLAKVHPIMGAVALLTEDNTTQVGERSCDKHKARMEAVSAFKEDQLSEETLG
jgi:uncharacterized coiled-coil protein SlyX